MKLQIPRDRFERIFKQKGDQKQGKIIRASQEQLRALSQRATSTKKGSRGTKALIKLQSQTPVYNNQYGRMFEACPDEFPQLQRTNVATAIVDIKQVLKQKKKKTRTLQLFRIRCIEICIEFNNIFAHF